VFPHKFEEKSKKNLRVFIKESANQNIIGRLGKSKGKDGKLDFPSLLLSVIGEDSHFEYQLTHLTQLADRLIKLLTSSHLSLFW